MIYPGESCVYIDNCVYCSGQHSMQILTQIPAAAAVTTRPASCCPHRGKVVRLPRQLHPARGEQSISHSGQRQHREAQYFLFGFLQNQRPVLVRVSLVCSDFPGSRQPYWLVTKLPISIEKDWRAAVETLPGSAPRPRLPCSVYGLSPLGVLLSEHQTDPKLYNSRWQCSG